MSFYVEVMICWKASYQAYNKD